MEDLKVWYHLERKELTCRDSQDWSTLAKDLSTCSYALYVGKCETESYNCRVAAEAASLQPILKRVQWHCGHTNLWQHDMSRRDLSWWKCFQASGMPICTHASLVQEKKRTIQILHKSSPQTSPCCVGVNLVERTISRIMPIPIMSGTSLQSTDAGQRVFNKFSSRRLQIR